MLLPFFGLGGVSASHSSINQAELIEKYIDTHREKIVLFAERYALGGNKDVRKHVAEFDDMKQVIIQIKSGNMSEQDAEKALVEIVKKAKQVNSQLQYVLKEEKQNFEKKLKKTQEKYQALGEHLSYTLNQVILKIISSLGDKKDFSEKQKNIIPHLKNLEEESKKLKNIGNINFQNTSEMKQSFLRILRNIKREIKAIRTIQKK
ncbi:hypothetical protein MK079_02305 [Candidatus Gracilibacteria bacterium]|nr:hypothetical protein [Candidatus Gracilibacteria bacterium]